MLKGQGNQPESDPIGLSYNQLNKIGMYTSILLTKSWMNKLKNK